MKTLRVAQILPSMRRAGAESVVATLSRGLATLDVEVHLVVIGNRFEYGRELANSGVHIHFLDLYQGQIHFYRRDLTIGIDRALGKFFADLKPDIAHFHLSHSLIWGHKAALLSGAKLFYTAHGQDPALMARDMISMWRRWQFARSVERSDCRLLAVASDTAQHLAQGLKIDPSRVEVQPNPLNLKLWKSPARMAPRPTRSIMVGTLYPLKRVNIGILALRELETHFELLVVGDGPEKEKLIELARTNRLDKRVKFMGLRENVAPLIRSSGVIWLLSEREGMPMVALEAMAAEIPIVASNVPGTNNLLKDGMNGLLVPLDNPQAVAEATKSLWEEDNLARRLTRGGLHSATRYDLPVIAREHYDRYQKAM